METEKNFRKIIRYRDFWMLKAVLDDEQTDDEKPASTLDEEECLAV